MKNKECCFKTFQTYFMPHGMWNAYVTYLQYKCIHAIKLYTYIALLQNLKKSLCLHNVCPYFIFCISFYCD